MSQIFPDRAHLQDGYILGTGAQPGKRHIWSLGIEMWTVPCLVSSTWHPQCPVGPGPVQGQRVCKHQQPSKPGPTRQASCAQRGEMCWGHSQSWPAQSGLECLMSNLWSGSPMWEERLCLSMLKWQLSSLFCQLSKYLARRETLQHLTIGIAGKSSGRTGAQHWEAAWHSLHPSLSFLLPREGQECGY